MYNFTGLPMVNYVIKWILRGKNPRGLKNNEPEFVISKNDVEKKRSLEIWHRHVPSS